MAAGRESTALIRAIFRCGSGVARMDKEQFRRELMYEATMSIYRQLLATGAITEDDYALLNEMMLKKYAPLFATLSGKNA